MPYFKVKAKCGHVSHGYYVEKIFPVFARTASEASQLVKRFPRVKKQRKDCITSCDEVSLGEYSQLLKAHSFDGYFKAKCRRQQVNLCPDLQSWKIEVQRNDFKIKKVDYHYRHRKMKIFEKSIHGFICQELNINVLNYKL